MRTTWEYAFNLEDLEHPQSRDFFYAYNASAVAENAVAASNLEQPYDNDVEYVEVWVRLWSSTKELEEEWRKFNVYIEHHPVFNAAETVNDI